MPDSPSRREAADPTVVTFRDDYYLFASKSGGYWWSHNLIEWNFVETNQIPAEDYAPTAVVIDDSIYFLASSSTKCPLYKSGNPKSGNWTMIKDSLSIVVWDPALFLDDDNRLYLYWGCSPKDPIHGVELDKRTFEPIGTPKDFMIADTKNHGWENPGDYNELNQPPWIEGAWMNKFNGKYYLQYATPGTEFYSYADGVYTSDNPLGPFIYAPINPFSYKPAGFIRGAGHGSTFKDRYGNLWHIATMTISVLHMFERRIGLFPAMTDHDGNLIVDAGITDRPIIMPENRFSKTQDLKLDWMLLSYKKPISASSSQANFPPQNADDENVRTSWCSASSNPGEWIMIDLGSIYSIQALQINYSDYRTNVYSRDTSCYYQYQIESSNDTKSWKNVVDKSNSKSDVPHDYIQLTTPIDCRYVRMTNYHAPGGFFALSDLRIFGNGKGKEPIAVNSLRITRDTTDRRLVNLTWNKSKGAMGYTVRFGPIKEVIPYSFPVYSDTSLILRCLNTSSTYYFSIDSFNENGITPSRAIQEVR